MPPDIYVAENPETNCMKCPPIPPPSESSSPPITRCRDTLLSALVGFIQVSERDTLILEGLEFKVNSSSLDSLLESRGPFKITPTADTVDAEYRPWMRSWVEQMNEGACEESIEDFLLRCYETLASKCGSEMLLDCHRLAYKLWLHQWRGGHWPTYVTEDIPSGRIQLAYEGVNCMLELPIGGTGAQSAGDSHYFFEPEQADLASDLSFEEEDNDGFEVPVNETSMDSAAASRWAVDVNMWCHERHRTFPELLSFMSSSLVKHQESVKTKGPATVATEVSLTLERPSVSREDAALSVMLNGQATRCIMKELRHMASVSTRFLTELVADSIYQWRVAALPAAFADDSRLLGELRNWTSLRPELQREPKLVFEIVFPEEYPFRPPFIRVVRPRFGEGFVLTGGGICADILTPQGWSPSYTIESVLVSVLSLMEESGRIDTANDRDYTFEEGRRSFIAAVKYHDWLPSNFLVQSPQQIESAARLKQLERERAAALAKEDKVAPHK